MDALLRLLPGPQPLAVRYGATAAMVLVSLALRAGIEARAGVYGFILLVPAIVASALLFDRGAGVFALGLSIVLIAATLSWEGGGGLHVAALASFLAVGLGLVLLGDGLRRALQRAHTAERDMDLLLQEMSHRVKNKFAMIVSMIGLQARDATPETRAALEAIVQRVRVVASVHDSLQLSRHAGLIDMAEYLGGLGRSLGRALTDLQPVTVSVHAERVCLRAEKGLAAGLIVNELVTNAFKHAFPSGAPGHVTIRLKRLAQGLELSITDDGIGCTDAVPTGFGTRLVVLLAAQLGGLPKWEPGRPGCRVSISFPAA